MIADHDPQGLYHALGLAPNATHAQISHAYREWAKAFHPDVTGSRDTTDFLRIKHAYDVLSDDTRRRQYDAPKHQHFTAEDLPAHSPEPSAEAARTQSLVEPVHCSVCNVIPVQPRHCIFHRVLSAVVYYRIYSPGGVYCRRCAVKKSLRESAVSWVFGWWGIMGVCQTPVALWRNFLLGEKPSQLNAELLIAQARYFVSIKELVSANVCLGQAAWFAKGANVKRLQTLRQSLPDGDGKMIRDEWAIYRVPASLAHAAPLLLLGATALAWQMSAPSGSSHITPGPVAAIQDPTAAPALPSDTRYVAVDRATMWVMSNGKYLNGGYLPQFTTVEVVGRSSNPDFVTVRLPDGKSVTLAASALANGDGDEARLRFCDDPVQEPPKNGEILRRVRTGTNRAVVTNNGDGPAVVKFRDLTGSVAIAAFVNGNAQAFINDFPDGAYRLDFATGSHWNRKCGFFEHGMDAQRMMAIEIFLSWDGVVIDPSGKRVTVAHTKTATYVIPPLPDQSDQLESLSPEAFARD